MLEGEHVFSNFGSEVVGFQAQNHNLSPHPQTPFRPICQPREFQPTFLPGGAEKSGPQPGRGRGKKEKRRMAGGLRVVSWLLDLGAWVGLPLGRCFKAKSKETNFQGHFRPFFLGILFPENRQKPWGNGWFWKERWLKRMELESTPTMMCTRQATHLMQ